MVAEFRKILLRSPKLTKIKYLYAIHKIIYNTLSLPEWAYRVSPTQLQVLVHSQ
jgi:hypothetical protein